MQTFYIKKIKDVMKNQRGLEKKLGIKIVILGRKVTVLSDPINEYEAELVFNAISFGFSSKKALALKNEEYNFKIIHIKSHTKRKLKDVLARLIGTRGKTKHTISEISGCDVLISESEVGILGLSEDVENTEHAIIKIIKGAKQTNTYRFLERMNRAKKNYSE